MKPIMRDFPYEFESKRLTIRGPLPGDGPIVREAVLESQDELKPWMPWAVDVPDEEWYEAFVRERNLQFLAREDLLLFLFLKGTNTFVGGSGFHRIDWSVPQVEIGYWVRTSFAGQGLITESTQALTDFAFEHLGAERVQIRCDTLNERSAAIPKRLGFELEGVLKHESRHHLTNELRDLMIFAKLKGSNR